MRHEPGRIFSAEAYALGKMLDHSGWYGLLPRGITPSDIDMVIDNNGDLLLVELKAAKEGDEANWMHVNTGQRKTYEHFLWNGNGGVNAVLCLCRHPEPGVQIDTLRDVVSFQPMFWDGTGPAYGRPYPGSKWLKFVRWWFGRKRKA